jgi:hypothetical protein
MVVYRKIGETRSSAGRVPSGRDPDWEVRSDGSLLIFYCFFTIKGIRRWQFNVQKASSGSMI